MNRKRKEDFGGVPPSSSKPRLSKGISIGYGALGALCFATKHVPEHTPKRWDLISNLVSDYSSANKENSTFPPTLVLKEQETAKINLLHRYAKR